MNRNILNFGKMAVIATALVATSCSADDDENIVGGNSQGGGTQTQTTQVEETLNIAYRVTGTSPVADWALLPLSEEQIKSQDISFKGNGYVLPSTRTYIIKSSNSGKYVYHLHQGTNVLVKMEKVGKEAPFYNNVGEVSLQLITGNARASLSMVDDKTALVYFVSSADEKDRSGSFVKRVSTLTIAPIDLETMDIKVSQVKKITLPDEPANAKLANIHISGVESAIVANGKVYFGVAKTGYDPTKTGREATLTDDTAYKAATLVLDYPSLTNPTQIEATMATGTSVRPASFYCPAYAKTESNEVYHITLNSHIQKINNGVYDASYDMDLTTLLGATESITTSAMYYAGGDVAYVTYAPSSVTSGRPIYADGKNQWNVARVDLKKKTAVKMNLPAGLWLTFYQSARLADGKLYMSLCPINSDGNVYIFDPKNETADGFTKGAKLEGAGGALYLGIF